VADVLFLIGSLEPSSLSRQLVALAPVLRGAGDTVRVIVLDRPSPWSEPLRQAGVPIEEVGVTSIFAVQPFLALRRQLRAERAIVHTWGRSAWRMALAAGVPSGRLIVSGLFRAKPRINWLERRFLRRARAVAFTGSEADLYRAAGLTSERITVVRPGVPDPGELPRAPLPGTPDTLDVLLGIGPLDYRKGFRDAIYANEMLRYLEDRRRLILLGDGDSRAALVDLVESFAAEEAVRFPGWQVDITPYLARADLVIAPAHGPGSVFAVLEAMAAGRTVVASNTPDLAEVIVPDETGVLVPVGDRMLLARACRFLLQDADRRRAVGQAARQAVLRTWALESLASSLRGVYHIASG
jgi:glycosyltransferase involved in cell wall biosynthesis